MLIDGKSVGLINPDSLRKRIGAVSMDEVQATIAQSLSNITTTQIRSADADDVVIADRHFHGPAGKLWMMTSAYGELVINISPITLDLTEENTWYKIVGWVKSDHNNGVTPNTEQSHMFVHLMAEYSSSVFLTISGLSTNSTYEFILFVNGRAIDEHPTTIVRRGSPTDVTPVTMEGLHRFRVGDLVDVRTRCIDHAGVTITFNEANFSIFSLPGS